MGQHRNEDALTIVRPLVLTALAAILTPLPASAQEAKLDTRPLAIVTEARGETWAQPPGGRKLEVGPLDWAVGGTILATGGDASMVVVFQNGMRTRLGEHSRLRVTADGPADATGSAHALPRVPALPQVGLVSLEGPATRINAVRVRGEAFARLHPDGAGVMAEAARLEFEPVREFSSYAISIEREDGTIVFETTSSATSIDVPPGLLRHGTPYYWRVSARDPVGGNVRGAGRFVTLTAEQAARRGALQRQLASSPAELPWLAEIDRSLGLLREALSGFERARAGGDRSEHVARRWQELDTILPPSR
jgi:hypothetical protein